MVPLAVELPSVDPITLGAAALTVVATLGAALKIVWTWLTELIGKFMDENRLARTDFLAGLQKIEDRRAITDQKLSEGQDRIHDALIHLHETLSSVQKEQAK